MDLIKWLLEGDVSIQYQTYRDLLGEVKQDLRNRIAKEGFGKRLLLLQENDGHWGGGYYRKKWISTHYTLLELTRLNIMPTKEIKRAIDVIIKDYTDNSNFKKQWKISDICMIGMMLYVFTYFDTPEEDIKPMIDSIIERQMPDGGYNCNYLKAGYKTKHSSLHSTISIIEAWTSFLNHGYKYRKNEIIQQMKEAIEFVLMHRLYKSDKTGEVIHYSFTMLSFPPRWKFDVLRALDCFREANLEYDERMQDAFDVIMNKRRKDGTWPLQNKHPGVVHFDMEKTGRGSRINTLRVLRVLKHFQPDIYKSLIN